MRHSDPLTALQALIERCRVQVDGRTPGSGFFVAPGFVLSCAHVAGGTPGAPAVVVHEGAPYKAVVLAASTICRPVIRASGWIPNFLRPERS